MSQDNANIYCVRANYGQYTEQFLRGGYVALGWFDKLDLSGISSREDIYQAYPHEHPEDTSPYVIGQQVGQVARFLFDMKPNDYVLTPSIRSEYIHWGIVEDEKVYFVPGSPDGCPYAHRRPIKWAKEPVQRSELSVPLQYSLRSSLTIFLVRYDKSFFQAIGHPEWFAGDGTAAIQKNYKEAILDRLMELDDKEFEILVTELLRTLGFEAQHTGKVGDQGVDVEGVLDVFNIAQVKLYVQVKRYKRGSNITPRTVMALRQNIPQGAQGAFITTSDFQKQALDVATQPGFPRIGTMNGSQLVDLLAEKWEELEQAEEIHELLEKLRLKRGLILDD